MIEHAKVNNDLILLTNISAATAQYKPLRHNSTVVQKLLDTPKSHTVALVIYSFMVINMASVD